MTIFPEVFWLVLLYACNNRCRYCYTEARIAADEKEGLTKMPLRYAQEVIAVMAEGGARSVLLIGGEPTLHPQLEQIVASAHQAGLKVTLVTNGRRLANREYFDRLVAAGVDAFTVSFEASNPGLYKLITLRDAFAENVAAIRHCVDSGVGFSSLTTIHKYNLADLSAIVELMVHLGNRNVAFNCGLPSVSQCGVDASCCLTPDCLAEVITQLYLRFRNDVKLGFNTTIPICLFDDSILEQMKQDKALGVGCQMFRGKGVAFDAVGNILPCTHFGEFPLASEAQAENGSFRYNTQSFTEFWGQSEPSCFRERLWRYPALKCKSCSYWGGCVGGCPLLWSVFDPVAVIG